MSTYGKLFQNIIKRRFILTAFRKIGLVLNNGKSVNLEKEFHRRMVANEHTIKLVGSNPHEKIKILNI